MTENFIQGFKANVGKLARPYLYYVNIVEPTPPVSQKYLVKTTSMPETVIEPIEIPYQGLNLKVASTATYGEWTCTFNVDNDMALRQFFIEWSKNVFDAETHKHGVADDYFGQIDIEMLDAYKTIGTPIYTTQLYGC